MFQLRISDSQVYSQGDLLDLLVAFNTEAFSLHFKDLKPEGAVIIDEDQTPKNHPHLPRRCIGAHFTRIAKDELRSSKVRNMIIIGYTAAHIGVEKSVVSDVVYGKLGSRKDLLQKNLSAIDIGYKLAPRTISLTRPTVSDKIVLSGHEAIVLGAVAAGCRFYAGYPITPAGDIIEEMATILPAVGGTLFQGEDEIASLGAAIGASFAGTKSMTATSGPGLSLMTEMIGLASMVEIPVVIVDAQRGGPSTGLPTKTEQSDLNHALYGGHGDAPRIVLAPGNVQDCFYQTVRAFNLAERYQLPVIVLTDQSLSQQTEGMSVPALEKLKILDRQKAEVTGDSYYRYMITHDGISSFSTPGELKREYVAESVEHDEKGRVSVLPNIHSEMMAKRFRKLETAATELANDPLNVMELSDPQAKVGVVGWGSTQGAIHEAILQAKQKSLHVSWLQCKLMNPLPKVEITSFIKGLRVLLVPELNYTSQFGNVLRAAFRIEPISLTKSEGLPFTAGEILRKIEEVAEN